MRAPITPQSLESLGMRPCSEAPVDDADVIEHRCPVAEPSENVGFRLRLLPVDCVTWLAEATCLNRTWPEGIGFGAYRYVDEIEKLIEAMQIRGE